MNYKVEEKKQIPDNCIFVGKKPFMTYMKSINTLFRGKSLKVIELRARGNNIKKAVDLAESSKRRFFHDLGIKTKKVELGTDNFKVEERELNVSTISIFLEKA